MSDIKNVALIGAGGNLGPSILQEFINSPFKVTVLSRQSSTSIFPSSVTVIKTDYSASSLASAFKNQDVVISIVGNEGFADQTRIIDAAIDAGVKRFIPSEFGSDTKNDAVRAIVPVFNGKKQVVDYLKTKESKTFSWTALVTGPFFDWGLKVGFLGFDLKAQTAKIWDSGNAPFSGTNLRTIGLALVKLLGTPTAYTESANQYVYVASHTASQNQILDALRKVTGKDWPVTRTQSEESIKTELEKFGKGDYSGVYQLIQAAAFGDKALGDFTKVEGGLWNERLSLPQETLEENVRAIVEG